MDVNCTEQALVRLLAKLGLIDITRLQEQGILIGSEAVTLGMLALQGVINEQEAISKIAEELQIEVVPLESRLREEFASVLDEEAVSKINVAEWKGLAALPVRIDTDRIVVAMANPLDHQNIRELSFRLGKSPQIAIASELEIFSVLEFYESKSEAFELTNIIDEAAVRFSGAAVDESISMSGTIGDSGDAAPIIRLASKIISDAVHYGASDVHISPGKEQLTVRVRVDGIMQKLMALPPGIAEPLAARFKIISDMDIAEKRRPQDGRVRVESGYGPRDLRVSCMPMAFGEKVVIRILASNLGKVSFDQLGMSDDLQDQLIGALQGTSKVILVCGPTGAGKTSTLYSALRFLDDGESNIVTVEDPIEYQIEGITQVQVNKKIDMTFAAGLRALLRQDPDVIMVGEIRDYETASIAMQAAQTGHKVLSTLHTNSAAAAITRLRDLGIPSYLIAASVGAIIEQRLLRKLCEHCAVPVSGASLKRYRELSINPVGKKEAVGCSRCNNTGYLGRLGIYGFIDFNDSVSSVVRAEGSEQEIMAVSKEFGYSPLRDNALAVVADGLSSLQEAERVLGRLRVDSEATAIISKLSLNAEKLHEAEVPSVNQVSVEAPAVIEPAVDEPTVDTARVPVVSQSTSIPKTKILLVDDDARVRKLLGMLFANEMFEVIDAANGREGLEQVYQNAPEIIVCDLDMPEMNGLELVKKLRDDKRTASIPILMLTSNDTEQHELTMFESGVNDYVVKTTPTKVLLARVKRLLKSEGL